LEPSIFVVIIVGFIAQLIDSSLGMAYGVSATSFLLGIGISPAAASASVHTSEIFTTAISGFSHWKLGNVNKEIVKRLLIPGVLGGVLGAYILTTLPGDEIKPFICIYLLIMAIRIIYKAFKPMIEEREPNSKLLIPLGFVGGTLDALGGGGWGPVVTTTLISTGHSPKKSIGSVNLTEFFVVAFIATIGLTHWNVILGLLIGGIIASPLGALLTKRVPVKALMIIVGTLIILLQLNTLYQIYF
jgi:uncharacterized membrane protein YfcA